MDRKEKTPWEKIKEQLKEADGLISKLKRENSVLRQEVRDLKEWDKLGRVHQTRFECAKCHNKVLASHARQYNGLIFCDEECAGVIEPRVTWATKLCQWIGG